MYSRWISFLLAALMGMLHAEGIRPGSVKPEELKEYASLTGKRKGLVEEALKLAAAESWLLYQYGGAEPAKGGMDCSGSMFYLLQQIGIDPPRTSQAQYEWVKEGGMLVRVPEQVRSLEDAVFARLRPGDLLFWSGTTSSSDGEKISHVQMFLGREAKDGHVVMVGASDGRTYRGTKRNGYGVFDFRLPTAGAKARFVGYGSPPGVK